MWITPGRPFWAGTRAFAANVVAFVGLDVVNIQELETPFRWGPAITASLFVALVVYAGAKLEELNGNGK